MVPSIARLVFLVLVFSTSALIQAAEFTNSFDGIVLGRPLNLTWTGDGTPVSIELLRWEALILYVFETIAVNVPASPYTWTPSPPIPAGSWWILSIIQGDSLTHYSSKFSISATGATGATSATSAGRSEEAVPSLNPFTLHPIEKRTDVGTAPAYPSRQPIAYPTRYLNITGTATGGYANPTGYINSSYSGYSVLALSPIKSLPKDSRVSRAERCGANWKMLAMVTAVGLGWMSL
ncbi:MAG: hypothetical protein Q9214_003490 [Letrouitia sp. 1 TL-2023]